MTLKQAGDVVQFEAAQLLDSGLLDLQGADARDVVVQVAQTNNTFTTLKLQGSVDGVNFVDTVSRLLVANSITAALGVQLFTLGLPYKYVKLVVTGGSGTAHATATVFFRD